VIKPAQNIHRQLTAERDLELDKHFSGPERIDAEVPESGVGPHMRHVDIADFADGALKETFEIGHGITGRRATSVCLACIHA
jgi:hypothetical protein